MEAIEKLKTLRKEATEKEMPWSKFIKEGERTYLELSEVKDNQGEPIRIEFINQKADLSGTPTHALEYLLKKTNDE